ncbi:5'/3'-nucleotidase SurE [Chitinibacter sp. ZOR0017]|uniref:5'/3'-nucleotidase SurE n=1 Tax=Chitinibacter sp. ZOR0017 TaxID=1339254 RepID=UPI0006457C2B|nr:5'/3'-nucleotidase SurE [Chitinibacter sp. ZOR0017]
MTRSSLLLGSLAIALASPSFALNIVLTNDDGLTSNLKALYEALKAKGHDVIVSVPCTGQSGMGAAAKFLTPLTPLSTSNADPKTGGCLNGAASAGEPAVGKMSKAGFTNGDYHYVNGTPIMATMYGLDVLAMKRWNKAPDLVLSGPNEGQNVGSIVNSSGTVSNAQFAAARGLAAIALSADSNTTDNTNLANPLSSTVAQLSLTLLNQLQAKAGSGPLLPAGLALNVNFPKELSKPSWRFAKFGSYNLYALKFVEDLGNDPAAKAYGLGNYHFPGVTISPVSTPASAQQQEDESAVVQNQIAVTAMQVGFEHRPQAQTWLRLRLRELFQ